MGKKRRHNRRHDAVTTTPHPHTANAPVAHAIQKILARSPLTQIEDRRKHHPDGRMRPAKTISGTRIAPHKIKTKKISVVRGRDGRPMKRKLTVLGVPSRIRFAHPLKTIICVKRKIRSEVLHAFKKTGRGASRKKHPHRNRYSGVSC